VGARYLTGQLAGLAERSLGALVSDVGTCLGLKDAVWIDE
jgi:hypothetical protein